VRLRLALVALAGVLCLGAASDPAERLSDPAREARARAVFQQVRCLVCQNESIDDSDAELAHDLRRLVREQVSAGRSDAEIKRYLIARYGEFVLLRPSFSFGNAALWGSPLLVAALGLWLWFGRLRARGDVDEGLSNDEAERLESLSRDDPS
jgi:cytochrome c-type biogenesis protein CcmH